MNKICLIEDEGVLAQLVIEFMTQQGFEVTHAFNLTDSMQILAHKSPRLVLLDLGLPDGNGEELVQVIRQKSLLPIIVLTAQSDESSKVRLLEAGADDYLTKPFGLAELLARVRVALRHTQNLKLDTVIRHEDLVIDLEKNEVLRKDEAIHLTATEWKLLRLLLENPGRLVPTARLLKDVWGEHAHENPHYLRIYMGHLRKKLEADPTHPQLILNETGVGYRWNLD